MTNKHLTVPPSDVALSRLKVLLESVNDMYHSGEMVLESNIVSSFHEALNLFYESLDGSIVGSVMKIYKGAPADPTMYNIFTTALKKDIEAVFSEVAALDRMVASSFNSIISEHKQAVNISKKVSNKLGDYLLYADPSLGAGYFFGDSFSTTDRTELNTDLVDTDQCYISPEEGVVLLPLDGSPDIPIVSSVTINQQSNGESGSNYQLDVFGHEDIEVISDNEPNTWFEYEKVTTSESNQPLLLDIIIALEEISVINHININPINFGTPTPIKIIKIETSKNGTNFTSIKDEVPLRDFVSEEEKEEFELSPATSKFSGQGFYSFLPRKAQYIHLVFEQHTPYTIETNNGPRLRYAIGIRDINILGRKFLEEGALVSTPFTSTSEIRKVSLWASENPVEESLLADLKHFISYNDGASWLGIQPQKRTGTDVDEIVNFNNISNNAIETETPVSTLRHKISMKRNKDSFNGDVAIKQERLKGMDIVSIPTGGQLDISLTERPIKKSVNILFPFMGSFSCPRPRYGASIRGQSTLMDLDFVEFIVDQPGERIRESDEKREGSIRFKLPFKGIPNLEERIRVFVNGEQIEYSPKTTSAFTNSPTSYTSINSDSKIYFLNKKGTELQFGYTDISTNNQYGYIPSGGSKIKVCLDGDNPFLRLTNRGYVLNLVAPSDGQKESVSIIAVTNMSDTEGSPHTIEIPPGVEKYKADPDTEAVPDENLTQEEQAATRAAIKVAPAVTKTTNKIIGAVTTPIKSSGEMPNTGNISNKNKKSGTSVSVISLSEPNKKALDYMVDHVGDIIDITMESEVDHENEDAFRYDGSFFVDTYDGMFPPLYIDSDNGLDHFDIIEYDLNGDPVASGTETFTNKVAFIDGDTELRNPSSWTKQDSYYTFDHYTGTVYLGSAPAADRRTVLVCTKRDLKIIEPMFWRFDRNQVTGKANTQKIILDPRVVFTMKRIEEFTYSAGSPNIRKISLVTGNEPHHDWTNISIVRGTVIPSIELFASNAKPIEIKFVDGESEFSNNVKINDEAMTFTSIGSNLYTYQLSKVDIPSEKTLIGTPTFAPIRNTTSASAPTNRFNLIPNITTDTPDADGEWIVSSTGLITVYLSPTLTSSESYVVSYNINNADPGIDINGMYSVDYNTGIIHFASPPPADGQVEFEVSAYSAFYNVAESVSLGDIDEINEDAKTITFNPAFGIKFLKQNTALAARPQVLKVLYEHYKKETESLEDLEPYFSPICKDLAFRSVTVDLLEEL